jgi:hypothetical protein
LYYKELVWTSNYRGGILYRAFLFSKDSLALPSNVMLTVDTSPLIIRTSKRYDANLCDYRYALLNRLQELTRENLKDVMAKFSNLS